MFVAATMMYISRSLSLSLSVCVCVFFFPRFVSLSLSLAPLRYADGTKNEDTFDTTDDPDDKGVKLPAQTSILFSGRDPVVSVGDEAGRVTVFKIHGLDLFETSGGVGLTPDQQAHRLNAAISQN